MHMTDCECTQPGWCERHQCVKSPTLFQLCRRSQHHYRMFECPTIQDTLRKAGNFTGAVVKHVASGARTVSAETVQARLSVCENCELCRTEAMVCEHPECGCRLRIKAKWATQDCPLEKWPKLTNTTDT